MTDNGTTDMNNATNIDNNVVTNDDGVDIVPSWDNYNLLLIEVTESGVISVIAGPKPFKVSFGSVFYQEIHSIQGYDSIIGSANLIAVAFCIRGHERLMCNRGAQQLCQTGKHLGGDVLVVVREAVFNKFVESHHEEYTISVDPSGEE